MSIRLIVGLGNPGNEYEQTRHNAGFWLVDQLARGQLRRETRFAALACKTSLANHDVWLLEPQTFMNRSGLSVAALANFYKITPESILVVHDELDLNPGVAKLKKGGSSGGHNGLKDIQLMLGTDVYPKLRFGIGNQFPKGGQVDFVLGKWLASEQPVIQQKIDKSIEVIESFAAVGLDRTMTVCNALNFEI